jgi:hypothetical protein
LEYRLSFFPCPAQVARWNSLIATADRSKKSIRRIGEPLTRRGWQRR